jgi:hypothetical protein
MGPLGDAQNLEIDTELPVINFEDFDEDGWFPILRLTYMAGYVAGTLDAVTGKPWALVERILLK